MIRNIGTNLNCNNKLVVRVKIFIMTQTDSNMAWYTCEYDESFARKVLMNVKLLVLLSVAKDASDLL